MHQWMDRAYDKNCQLHFNEYKIYLDEYEAYHNDTLKILVWEKNEKTTVSMEEYDQKYREV
jgi:hypothetical protein